MIYCEIIKISYMTKTPNEKALELKKLFIDATGVYAAIAVQVAKTIDDEHLSQYDHYLREPERRFEHLVDVLYEDKQRRDIIYPIKFLDTGFSPYQELPVEVMRERFDALPEERLSMLVFFDPYDQMVLASFCEKSKEIQTKVSEILNENPSFFTDPHVWEDVITEYNNMDSSKPVVSSSLLLVTNALKENPETFEKVKTSYKNWRSECNDGSIFIDAGQMTPLVPEFVSMIGHIEYHNTRIQMESLINNKIHG